ncbi:Small nuclear ribonucleoprotein f [Paragonimus heterotremus]|uniref:Small nuclear ribonucleoprotein f n=1 Tax=Paragonimus heterotremus TaxID=100268 RepID=A0A8J4WDY7_9TREM|nr:Small nuclear ribonucleoprotein f [Paragonimus heterotremus]
MTHKQTPRDFLKLIIGRPVVVKLNSGADYRGVLISLDGYMNVVLEQTEEYVDGQLKNKYGDTFIRGNNVLKNVGELNNLFVYKLYANTCAIFFAQ